MKMITLTYTVRFILCYLLAKPKRTNVLSMILYVLPVLDTKVGCKIANSIFK